MSYDKKFKLQVLKHLDKGHTQQATAELFEIGLTTLKAWKKQREAGETLESKVRVRKPKKIQPERLREYMMAHPNAYIREIAKEFSCANSTVQKALKRLNIKHRKRK